MKTIVLTGGGTLGHALPHLAIYPYLKNSFDDFYYIGSSGGAEEPVMSKTFKYYGITTAKLKRYFSFDNLTILSRVLKGIREAEKILTKLKPDVVFSKGGYVSVPVIFAAKKLKIPVVAHESDYTVGLANKLVSKKCASVLTSFSDTAKNGKNYLFTGPPVREFNLDKPPALKRFGFSGHKPVLLILGGSMGSLTINNAITGLLPDLLKKYDVLHVGVNDIKKEKIKGYFPVKYLDDISLAYSVCDVAVSRSGAGASFELMNLKIPTLFIPLSKKASRGDQILNARYFLKKGMCNILYEENLNPAFLLDKIDKTYAEKNYYINNMKKCENLCGNRRIAEVLCKYGEQKPSAARSPSAILNTL